MLWVLFLTLEMGGCEQNFGTICVLVVMNVVTGKTAARGPQCPLTGCHCHCLSQALLVGAEGAGMEA